MSKEKAYDIGEIIERLSEAVHKAYCEQYEKKHGKPYWTIGDYSLLDEETKEYDRVTVRAVLVATSLIALWESNSHKPQETK